MKKLAEIVTVRGAAIALVVVAEVLLCGCSTADCENSDTAEFPTVERWWK